VLVVATEGAMMVKRFSNGFVRVRPHRTQFATGYVTKFALTRGIVIGTIELGVFPNPEYVRMTEAHGPGQRSVHGALLLGRDVHLSLSEAEASARFMATRAANNLKLRIQELDALAQTPKVANPQLVTTRRKKTKRLPKVKRARPSPRVKSKAKTKKVSKRRKLKR
jgi:hypothetical protein